MLRRTLSFLLPALFVAIAGPPPAWAAPPDLCADRSVPAAARELGFTNAIIDVCPKFSDITFDPAKRANLYNGHWWNKDRAPPSTYGQAPDGLVLRLGGALTTISPTDGKGALPLLPGSKGFYVEFDAYISGNESDHWPALWLMPIEHNAKQDDVYPGDPPGFERWMELDVDEGGFTRGWLGSLLSWSGKWPDYQRLRNPYAERGPVLDRTKPHTFSASFDPRTMTVRWWLDGEPMDQAGAPYVPEVARKQNFYLLLNAQSHGKNLPYEMVVRRFRAFVPAR